MYNSTHCFVGIRLERDLCPTDKLVALENLASRETTLDRLWHTNCFTQALQSLRVERCQAMTPEDKSRLALALANCQLQVGLAPLT